MGETIRPEVAIEMLVDVVASALATLERYA
jgi:hypothetical protein